MLSPCPAVRITASAKNFERRADPSRLDGWIFTTPRHDFLGEAIVSVHGEWAIRDIARLGGIRPVAGKWEVRILRRLDDPAYGHMSGARLGCKGCPLPRRIIARLLVEMRDCPKVKTNLVA